MATDYSGLQWGQQYFPDEVDETVTNIQYPGGNPVYPSRPPWQAGNPHIGFNMPAANTNKYIQRKEDTEPGFLRKTWDKTKDLASQAKGAPLGLLNLLTQRQGATESFSGYPGGQFSRAGLFPNEVQNLQALADQNLLRSGGKDAFGTNVVSLGGDYNQKMADKKAQFTAKLEDADYLATLGMEKSEDNTLKDLYNAYITKYGSNAAIAKRLNHYANFGGAADVSAADKITTGAPDFITQRGQPAGPVTTGGGGTFDPMFDVKGRGDRGGAAAPSWRGATAAREARGEQVAGPGFGRGAYWAEGGRVGYQDGELVEDEYMAEATPAGMMEENIEEVQGEPTREQLEVIALEIFRLPLEELNEEQLNVVYQAAMEQEPAEEEVQFAAQEGPGEGIASLV
jgi:hypothetical protein